MTSIAARLAIAAVFATATFTSPAFADFAGTCAGCHGPLDSLPNGSGQSGGAIRAANNPAYLKLKIQGSMGGLNIVNFSDAAISTLANEIRGGPTVAGPVVTSAALGGGTYNVPYSRTITATGAPTPLGDPGLGITVTGFGTTPSPFTITSGALPPGLLLDNTTGVVSGTPTAAGGPFTGTITVSNMVNTAAQPFSITIAKASQTISFLTNPAPNVLNGSFSVSTSVTSGLPRTYTSLTTGVCTVNLNTGVVTIVTGGLCTIAANQVGNVNYLAAPQVTQNITISKASQTVSFLPAPTPTYAPSTNFMVTANASSGLPVTYSSTSPACFVLNNATGLIAINTAGPCVVNAIQAGNSSYNAAVTVTQTVTIAKANQAITFGVPPSPTYSAGGTFTVAASVSPSGSAVAYSTSSPACTVQAATGMATIISAGTCVIAANQPGNANYNPAPQVTQAVTIAKAIQTLGFAPAPTPTYAPGGTFNVLATASPSGLAVTYSVPSTTRVCSVNASSGQVSMLSGGVCSIAANQAGGTNYTAANQVMLNVTIARATQTLSFMPPPALTYAPGAFERIMAVATSNLGPIYMTTTPAVCDVNIDGDVIIHAAGLCTITADQPGNPSYLPAPQVTLNLAIAKGGQKISFAPAPSIIPGGTGTVTATASSGLAVTYSTSTPACSVNASTGVVSGLSAGACTIAADQSGDGNYNPALQATVAFMIGVPTLELTVDELGTGTGTITSAPTGINCGAACAAQFSVGSSVALTATPDAGSMFAGWSGACSGTGACTVTMDAAKSVIATFDLATDIPRLSNISTRMQVLGGNDVLIGGFVIGGSSSKTVVVRARGPSLIPFGITNALANPTLQLVRSSDQATIATNDDWQSNANAAAITASGFAPGNNLESAILMNLPPGAYTAIVSGVGGATGVGIVEVFEVDMPDVPLANISTRGQVLTGNDVMIGGFVVQGTASQTLVIRARGPSLIPFGITNALGNPTLQLVRSSDQVIIDANDDWQSNANAAQIASSGFAPSNPLESALLVTLPPGAYTVIVSGVGGTTGVGIVEVFAQ